MDVNPSNAGIYNSNDLDKLRAFLLKGNNLEKLRMSPSLTAEIVNNRNNETWVQYSIKGVRWTEDSPKRLAKLLWNFDTYSGANDGTNPARLNVTGDMDFSNCSELYWIECDSNSITSINVNNCPKLERLRCKWNQITNLDVSNHKELMYFICDNNNLESINVSGCSNLNYVELQHNQLSDEDLSTMYGLPIYGASSSFKKLDLRSNKGFTEAAIQTLANNLPNLTYDDILWENTGTGGEVNLTQGLVAYYPFNGNANDMSGNGNNGTGLGDIGYIQETVSHGTSAHPFYANFGGYYNSSAIKVNNSSSLQFSNKISISIWYKLKGFDGMDGNGKYNSTVTNHCLIAKDGDRGGFGIFLNKECSNYLLRDNNTSISISSKDTIELNTWVHFITVVDSNKIKFYKNGVLIIDTTYNQNISFSVANTKDLYIGRFGFGDGGGGAGWYPFNGDIDDIRIYNRALNPAEVTALYEFVNTDTTSPASNLDSLGGFLSGSGTQASPYLIQSTTDLNNLATFTNASAAKSTATSGKYFKLTTNLDYGGGTTTNFTPIGNSMNTPFQGNFMGDAHTISGIVINTPLVDWVGVWGYISGGSVKNLGIVNCNIIGRMYVGGLVGRNNGTISYCFSTGSVSSSAHPIGGFVGENYSTISNCYSKCSVSGGATVGGFIGSASGGAISNCYSTGSVISNGSWVNPDIGGFAGWNGSTIANCYYLNTSYSTSAGGTSQTMAQMKAPAFAQNTLTNGQTNYPWLYDSFNLNNGYPIITWQRSGIALAVAPHNNDEAQNNDVSIEQLTENYAIEAFAVTDSTILMIDVVDTLEYGEIDILSVKITAPIANIFSVQWYYGGYPLYDITSTSCNIERVGDYYAVVALYNEELEEVVEYQSNTITINPKYITVEALGGQSMEGSKPENPGLRSDGLAYNEKISVLKGLYNDFNITDTTPAGTYPLSVVGELTNRNYEVVMTLGNDWVVKSPNTIEITEQPLAGQETAIYGDIGVLEVKTQHTGLNISYQWYYNEDAINGDTTASCPVIGTGYYWVVVSNKKAGGNIEVQSTTIIIYPKDVIVTALSGESLAGTKPENPGISSSELAFDEDVSVLTGIYNDFSIDETTPIGTYTLSVDGVLLNENYNITEIVDGTWEVKPTGIDESSNSISFTLYPNETTGKTIFAASVSGESVIEIMDLAGNVVYTINHYI